MPATSRPTADRSGGLPGCGCRGSIRTCQGPRTAPCSTRWRPGSGRSGRSSRSTTMPPWRWPKPARIAPRVSTRLGELQHQLEERDGWRLEQRVETVVSRLSLPAERSLGELSGGWRRRTLLGKALVSEPDLLLLDEPTNHLDIDAIQWLEEYLREFSGALLFVTHDRAFLSALATRIVDLDRGTLTSWPGAYSSYLDKKAEAENADARALERLDKKLEKEEAWLRQGVKARRTRNEGRVRALHGARARACRAAGDERRRADDGRRHRGVWPARVRSGPRLQVVRRCPGRARLHAAHPARAIASASSVRTARARRRCSGCWWGSSSRTRARSRAAPGCGSRTSISSASSSIPSSRSPTASTTATTPSIINGEPRHIIGYLADFLFPRERAVSPIKSLSGGERNRLMLARLFARPANVLVHGRADQRSRHRDARAARGADRRLSRHGAARQPRPRVPRQHRDEHAGVRRERAASSSTSVAGRTI